MELGEGDAKICRLCGQCESIYIDVFGEEGTKRLLGLKIYTKINILIQKNDGLPHVVCMQCIGTVEFLGDFYNNCHFMQEKLKAAKNDKEKQCQVPPEENDTEADKENAVPRASSSKSKAKALKPASSTIIKDCVTKNNLIDSVNVNVNLNCDNNGCMKRLNRKQMVGSENLVQNNERRKRGRKSIESNLLTNLKTENDNIGNKSKRYCLRPICTNSKVNGVTNSATIASKPRVGQVAAEKVLVIGNNCVNIVRNNDKVPDTSATTSGKNNSVKSKATSVIVKQEKPDPESTFVKRNRDLNKLMYTRNKIQTEEVASSINNQSNTSPIEILETSPQPREETNTTQNHHCDQQNDLKPKLFTENRATVIKSPLNYGIIVPKPTNQNTDSDKKSDISSNILPQQCSQSNHLNDDRRTRKNKNKFFHKISDLMSKEQSLTIEKYYTVNDSVVKPEEVQKHLAVTDKKEIHCKLCGHEYVRMDKCKVHIWNHLAMKPYECKMCNFSTVTVTNIRCHIRKSHLKFKPFACHLCEKRYVTAALLEEHINTHTGARPYKCDLCDFATSRRQMLSYHKTTHKATKDVYCTICEKGFYSKNRLRTHMMTHNNNAVVCKLCSAYLSSPEALQTHHKRIHMQDYVCDTCGKRFNSRKAVNNHQNVHTEARYKCNLCPKVYKSRQILKEHILKHEGVRKYKCAVCAKAFAQQSHLAAHRAVHSDVRYHCPGCSKAFNRHDNMKIHCKRCKMFLANPDLKIISVKKERNESFIKPSELPVELENENTVISSSSERGVNKIDKPVENNEPPKKELLLQQCNLPVEDNNGKLVLNYCELGVSVSCIEPGTEAWDKICQKEGNVQNADKMSIMQIMQTDGDLVLDSGVPTVVEKILHPENF